MNLREGRIGKQESACLAAIPMLTAGIFTGSTMAYQDGNSSYVSAPLSAFLSLLLFLIAAKAMARRNRGNLTELLCDAFGAWLGRAVGLLFAFAFVVAAAVPLIRFSLVLHRYVFIESSIDNLLLYFAGTILVLAVFGLETIGRTAKLFFAIIAGSLLVTIAMTSPTYETYRLYPLLGDGVWAMLQNTAEGIGKFLPALLLLLCCCRGVHGVRNAARAGRIAAIGTGLGCAAMLLCLGMAYSYRELSEVYAPMYRLTMSLAFGSYLRTDKILLFLWTLGSIVGAAAFAYGGAKQFSEAFRLRDIRPPAAVFGTATATVALLAHLGAEWFAVADAWLTDWFWLILITPVAAASAICLIKKERAVCIEG